MHAHYLHMPTPLNSYWGWSMKKQYHFPFHVFLKKSVPHYCCRDPEFFHHVSLSSLENKKVLSSLHRQIGIDALVIAQCTAMWEIRVKIPTLVFCPRARRMRPLHSARWRKGGGNILSSYHGDHYSIWVESVLQRGCVSSPPLEDATLARMRRKVTLLLVLCSVQLS